MFLKERIWNNTWWHLTRICLSYWYFIGFLALSLYWSHTPVTVSTKMSVNIQMMYEDKWGWMIPLKTINPVHAFSLFKDYLTGGITSEHTVLLSSDNKYQTIVCRQCCNGHNIHTHHSHNCVSLEHTVAVWLRWPLNNIVEGKRKKKIPKIDIQFL